MLCGEGNILQVGGMGNVKFTASNAQQEEQYVFIDI
jgi:hypothetical protein